MAINSFWQNPFGANVASSGVDPGPPADPGMSSAPPGLMAQPAPTGMGMFGKMLGGGPSQDPNGDAARQAFIGSLLSGSGWSPTRQTSTEIFGRALLASQQARAASSEAIQKKRYVDAQIGALERDKNRSPFGSIDPDQFTPESLAEFQRSGNYGVLKPRGGLVGMGNVNPGEYTPESVAKYAQSHNYGDLVRYVAPAQPSVQIVNGVPTVVQPTRPGAIGPAGPMQNPLSSLKTETDAAAALAAAKANAGAVGTATGEAAGGKLKRGANADTVIGMLDLAEPLIDASTGSLGGAGIDKLAAAFGKAPKGAEAVAQLKIIQAGLMTNMPRMEGPQSDRDVQLYRDASGQIGDPTVPNSIKKVAVKTIRQLQERYKDTARQVPTIFPNGSPEAEKADIEAEMRRRGLLK